jgi:hypothetical protein
MPSGLRRSATTRQKRTKQRARRFP